MGLLCIIVLGYVIAIISKNKWLEALPVSAFLIMLLTYLMGLGGWLNEIWLLKYGICGGCAVALFFYFFRNSENRWKIKNGISVGLLLFIGMTVGMAFLLKSHLILEWDDFSHWAITVKQMFYIKAIPNGQKAISSYSDYPPIGSLFIYWFLSDFKEFHEELIFPVYYFGVLLCLTPYYIKIPEGKNKIGKQIIAFIICILLPGAFASTAMVNLKIDSFVAVLFGYIVISVMEIIFIKNKFFLWDILKIFSALSVMMLTKSVGIYLSMVITIALLILAIYWENKKYIGICIAGTVVELIFYVSWKLFCQIYGNSSYISVEFGKIQKLDYLRTLKAVLVQMPWFLYPILVYIVSTLLLTFFIDKEKMSEKNKQNLIIFMLGIDGLISFFCRSGFLDRWFEKLIDDGSKEYITKHYIYYFCRQSVNFQLEENVTYGMSALECIMLIIIVMFLIRFSAEKERYKEYLIVQVSLWIGFIVYVAGHLAMYRYMFHGSEASVLSAYSRYLMMYLGGFLGGAFYLLYCNWTSSENLVGNKYLNGILLGSIIFLSNIPFTYMCIFQYNEGVFAERWAGREKGISIAEKIRQEVGETAGGILITEEDDLGLMALETRYFFAPERGLYEVWAMSNIMEEDISERLENIDAVRNVKYLAVDMTEEFSEETLRKLDKILEYYHIEEKDDFPVCVYKL